MRSKRCGPLCPPISWSDRRASANQARQRNRAAKLAVEPVTKLLSARRAIRLSITCWARSASSFGATTATSSWCVRRKDGAVPTDADVETPRCGIWQECASPNLPRRPRRSSEGLTALHDRIARRTTTCRPMRVRPRGAALNSLVLESAISSSRPAPRRTSSSSARMVLNSTGS